ncbi:Bis(5'-nucleosyl)-tetraphosphatase PrpE [asymmetrical] [Rubripirellula obstinata]|uniref:Bis(5'-nucleosyl)-tetraphosphatase PrpE [asymmetrical] n=1 Tax=Rubripirellula obstinata TaxID=406547 RepID=A0A5B1CEW3_9BACT|nr:metallophosphoesterase [Rubripirellula obstinata]KAA1258003.1 Bis(5'-nucleosyl)-tetraphosphatase PrpE [asymmetrical] [Rubripirellula obstinata]
MVFYDIIGDIHGHADELKNLLKSLGYQRHGDGFRCFDRKVVFVGDFVDRGPAIGEVVEIARAMVDAGDALAVMGNHEYNAIAFHTAVPGTHNQWFRPRPDKNIRQHVETLSQLSDLELSDAIEWFKTLPVAIEIGGIRVAHASWQTRDIDCINDALAEVGRFTPDFLAISEESGSDLNNAIENVLKGPELRLPAGHSIVDKAGHRRGSVRIKWYEDGTGRTYRQHHLGSDDVPDVAIADGDLAGVDAYPRDAVPVFVGHYWLMGTPTPLAANVACTDYSVAKGGKLVAYRWDGESVLSPEKFYWADGSLK